MKKVLHISGRASYDGTAVYPVRLAKHLTDFEHDLLFISAGLLPEDDSFPNVKTSILSDLYKLFPFGFFKPVKLLLFFSKNKYDIIHYHSGGLLILLFSFLFNRNSKFIHHVHCGNINCKPGKTKPGFAAGIVLKYLKERTYRVFSGLNVYKKYLKYIGKSAFNILILNAVPPGSKNTINTNYVVGYLGQINKEKNVKLISGLLNADDRIRILAKGDITVKLNPENKNLTIEPPGLNTNLFFNKIDFLFFPSTAEFEGIPLVILEAAERNIPIIAFKSNQVSEILGDYPFLFSEYIPGEIVVKIENYYKKDTLKKIIEDKHNDIRNRFNFDEMIQNIRLLYNE